MKVSKSPSELSNTDVWIGLNEGLYFPRSDGSGWVFVDDKGKANLITVLPMARQIPVVQGETVTLQF